MSQYRKYREVNLTSTAWGRVEYLSQHLDLHDTDEIIARAVYLFDCLAAAAMEGSTVVIHHRDGTRETLYEPM